MAQLATESSDMLNRRNGLNLFRRPLLLWPAQQLGHNLARSRPLPGLLVNFTRKL